MPRLPKRSAKLGVGKEIGGAVYIHRLYEHLLPEQVTNARLILPVDFQFTVIKYCWKNASTTFIDSPEFDHADEPAIGAWVTVSAEGTSRLRAEMTDPYIYHHKWLFVRDDYQGFDVAASKKRSLSWLALADVDKSRIGRRSYWNKHVVPRIEGGTTWFRSSEAAKVLGVSSCELAHLREAGNLEFKKSGNAFLYRLSIPPLPRD